MVSLPENSLTTFVEYWNLQKSLNENADDRPKTPNLLNDIKIYGEVSFTHKVISRTTTRPSPNIVIGGRVDHSIGRILKTRSCRQHP